MASRDAVDDYEWQPPTEAEMKILQARRERSDRISKLMGDYLLKGYKMLGSSCQTCMTILLQDKQGRNYCVACSELDADGNKDDPALSREAAQRQVAEERERTAITPDSPSTPGDGFEAQEHPPPPPPRVSAPPRPAPPTTPSPSTHATGVSTSTPSHFRDTPTSTVIIQTPQHKLLETRDSVTSSNISAMDMSQPIRSVKMKLQWACSQLDQSASVDGSIQLCQLIRSCADALISLHTLHAQPGQSG